VGVDGITGLEESAAAAAIVTLVASRPESDCYRLSEGTVADDTHLRSVSTDLKMFKRQSLKWVHKQATRISGVLVD